MSKPTHRAKVGVEMKKREGDNEAKTYWYDVGAIFQHKTGGGFDLLIPEGISISGRIACFPITDDEERA